MTPNREHAIVQAVLYAVRCGCFFPVPEPKPGATTHELIQWGAMRQLHNAIADLDRPEPQWRQIASAPRNERVFFWIVPKTAEETYCDTSGKPIMGDHQPYRHEGKFGTWGSLSKAIYWMPLPDPPVSAQDRTIPHD